MTEKKTYLEICLSLSIFQNISKHDRWILKIKKIKMKFFPTHPPPLVYQVILLLIFMDILWTRIRKPHFKSNILSLKNYFLKFPREVGLNSFLPKALRDHDIFILISMAKLTYYFQRLLNKVLPMREREKKNLKFIKKYRFDRYGNKLHETFNRSWWICLTILGPLSPSRSTLVCARGFPKSVRVTNLSQDQVQ